MVHPEHSNCSSNELKITILVFFNNNQERLDCNMDKTSILKSELRGIVVLLKDFKTEALLPVFEAVINSIQSIEERFGKDMKSGEIRVIVHRTLQPNLPEIDTRKEPEIISFEITDNGIGFTDRNMDSFKTVASSYKLEKGGKGIGRFTWLKAFENVEIDSVYKDDKGKTRRRTIQFSLDGLYELIKGRKTNPQEGSYTTYLFDKGLDKILKKVGEESTEVIVAGKGGSKEETIYEISDLVYHVMVLMVQMGISTKDIIAELEKRHVIDKKVKQETMK